MEQFIFGAFAYGGFAMDIAPALVVIGLICAFVDLLR